LADIGNQDECPDHARDTIDVVAATIDALAGVVEHGIFSEDLVDSHAPPRRVLFTEDIMKIARQQGRYGLRHGDLILVGACKTQILIGPKGSSATPKVAAFERFPLHLAVQRASVQCQQRRLDGQVVRRLAAYPSR